MKPHKHAAVIKAWADGAVIQASGNNVYWRPAHNPDWNEHTYFRASIAEVEGKPVFVGDVLYGDKGGVYTATLNLNFDPKRGETLSWNPPSKTITVTIPRPDNEMRISTYYYPALAYTNPDDQAAAIEAIKEAMK